MKEPISTNVAGVSFYNRQAIIGMIAEGSNLKLIREPHNPFDKNAIRVEHQLGQIGYIPRDLAKDLAKEIDKGEYLTATTEKITGGYPPEFPTLGVIITIENDK